MKYTNILNENVENVLKPASVRVERDWKVLHIRRLNRRSYRKHRIINLQRKCNKKTKKALESRFWVRYIH